jgi:general secretion pathway protein K
MTSQTKTTRIRALSRRLSRRQKERGVALVIVLSSLALLAVMLTEFQDETSADYGHALAERDALKAEYAAKSAVNLSRLLIASEPTIRRAVAPLFIMMRQGPPQIPVWEYADQILGAFNDKEGTRRFKSLAAVDMAQGKNLGLEGAGFEIVIVDEDSKMNFNLGARGDAFSKQRMAAQVLGMLQGLQYEPLFAERDANGDFHSRQQICAAVVDWSDFDQEGFPCDLSGTNVTAGGEDSYYQLLENPYERKNAAFDSLDELHMVRGISDDFWNTFIEPDFADPKKRVVTVWGGGKVNVNTANAQATLGIICAYAVEGTKLCEDPIEQAKFLSVLGLVKTFTAGIPVFGSPKSFVSALKGKGMFGAALQWMELEPITLKSEDELMKAIDSQSHVFSIYATGVATAGKRRTVRRIHAVVDFRGAPAPPDLSALLQGGEGSVDPTQLQDAIKAALPKPDVPDGATEDTLEAAFRPSPGGRVIYYRID